MAKVIRLSEEHIKQCFDAVSAESKKRMLDGKLSFAKVFDVPNQKADVYFTSVAWVKMMLLLDQFEKEVGWYGVASRLGADEDNTYLISDIVVYPQVVTAATVEMDEEEYSEWLYNHDEDKYYSLFMHGHSHVRMGCTPSSTDLEHQQKIVDQLPEDGFYIFMIYNKSLQHTVSIFDMKKNIHFENKDVNIGFYDEGVDYFEFMKESRGEVRERACVSSFGKAAPKTGTSTGNTAKSAAAKPAASTAKSSVNALPAATGKSAADVKAEAMRNIHDQDVYGGLNFWYDDDEDMYWDSSTGMWIDGEDYRQEWRKKHGLPQR